MYDNRYLIEKFTMAMHHLVSGEGDARSRVGEAYYSFWHIKPDEYPEHLRNKREEINHLLTRLPGREGYMVPDNLSKMKNKTASKIAVLIFEIYFELNKLK